MLDINEFAEKSYQIALQRKANGANVFTTPSMVLKHCASEVVEATEAYFDLEKKRALLERNPVVDGDIVWRSLQTEVTNLEDELADIVCCACIVSAELNLDMAKALKRCQRKNQARAMKVGDKL